MVYIEFILNIKSLQIHEYVLFLHQATIWKIRKDNFDISL